MPKRIVAGFLKRSSVKSIPLPGLVPTVQAAGEALQWNPHLHGIITSGMFKADGSFEAFTSIDVEAFSAHFAKLVCNALCQLELIDADTVSQILSSQEHKGFSVWVGEPFSDKERELFVARYIERGTISLEKLSLNGSSVIYTTKDGLAHNFDALEFLALLSSHIPNPAESVTRYFGYYSCRARGERAEKGPTLNQISSVLERTSSTYPAFS